MRSPNGYSSAPRPENKRITKLLTTHEGRRLEYDTFALHGAVDHALSQHLVQVAAERTEIWIELVHDLGVHKARLFAHLDCRSGEDDALDTLLFKGGGTIGVTGNRRSQTEAQLAGLDGGGVMALCLIAGVDKTGWLVGQRVVAGRAGQSGGDR